MFQDINPHQLDARYEPKPLKQTDFVVLVNQRKILMLNQKAELLTPTVAELTATYDLPLNEANYLLSIEGHNFFTFDVELVEAGNFTYESITVLRGMMPQWLAFATATAGHLANWYDQNRYCGHCAYKLEKGTDERKLVCPNCGAQIFPKISPVIIVGVTKGDQLLLTKYATGYGHFALIAGFVEIGETLEGAVKREVYEETGLEVQNLRYYKSQPWAFSQSVLMGFFADLASADTYSTAEFKDDEQELALKQWFDRDAIPHDDTRKSLTWDMIEAFREDEIG